MKKNALLISFLALIAAAGLFTGTAAAQPPLDGGGFPTPSPTPTWTPTETATLFPTATDTVMPAIAVTVELPQLTETAVSIDSVSGSNIIQEAQPEPVQSPRSPLLAVAYIGLFIFLLAGVWLLFGRGRAKP